MASVTFVEQDGTRHTVEGEVGESVMAAAVRNVVPGILAECGGARACATCHVYVDAAWFGLVGAAQADESALLEFAEEAGATSRLCCQIVLEDQLDGLVVHVPASQH